MEDQPDVSRCLFSSAQRDLKLVLVSKSCATTLLVSFLSLSQEALGMKEILLSSPPIVS
jgi:hypothetical protein